MRGQGVTLSGLKTALGKTYGFKDGIVFVFKKIFFSRNAGPTSAIFVILHVGVGIPVS